MNREIETAQGFYDGLRRLYQERLPFNRLLGLSVTSLNSDGGAMSFSMREDLIGNVFHRTLHGGVISSVLDAVGGLTASASLMVRAAGLSEEKIKAMFAQVGTIDLRVDYLRPGRGEAVYGQWTDHALRPQGGRGSHGNAQPGCVVGGRGNRHLYGGMKPTPTGCCPDSGCNIYIEI